MNLASLSAAHEAYINAAAQPILPTSLSIQLKARTAGAIPKETISERLSYCRPKSLDVFVIRATVPSRTSNIIAIKMAMQAASNFPSMPAKIA